jgi:hypothetical protein
MDLYHLFEECVRNEFSSDVHCEKINETTIFVKETKWTYYLNESDTRFFRENISLPSIVYELDSLAKEKIYFLKLHSQAVVFSEYQLGDKIILESQFKNGKQFSNTCPIKPLIEEEIDLIKKFQHLIEHQIKNREDTRLFFTLNMLEIKKQGSLVAMKQFPKYRHIDL